MLIQIVKHWSEAINVLAKNLLYSPVKSYKSFYDYREKSI
jgi:hypothetical protein